VGKYPTCQTPFFFLFLSDTCTFKLDKEHLKVSELFSLLNKEKTRLGILDWGVKMTTLEDGELHFSKGYIVLLSRLRLNKSNHFKRFVYFKMKVLMY